MTASRVALHWGVGLVALMGCSRRTPPSDRADASTASLVALPDRLPDCGRNDDCDASSFCDFAPGLCGRGAHRGTCRARPIQCAPSNQPVCGCDGRVHPSECESQRSGTDLAVNGGCRDAPAGDWIPCGASFCDARLTYCEIVLSDVAELPTDYTCLPLPPACAPEGGVAASCDCFPKGTRCRSFCGHVETGGVEGFHLTCQL